MAKSALLVGINDYKEINDLSGCINDVTNMRNILLTYFDFRVEDIRVLFDQRATKDNILKRLRWMVGRAQKGDTVVFHFSGHGSHIRDRGEKDELQDGYDEVVCPYDMDWDTGKFILDDDLAKIFKGLKAGVNLTVILDSCYSGTATRASVLPPEEHARKERFLRPPPDIELRMREGLKKKSFGKSVSDLNHILLAGCKDDQTSADDFIEGDNNGAFTFYFGKRIRDAQGHISYANLIKRVRESLRYHRYEQIPQLEGPEARLKNQLFS